MELFRICKWNGAISIEAKWNAKDLSKDDIEKIDELIKVWKRVTIRQVA